MSDDRLTITGTGDLLGEVRSELSTLGINFVDVPGYLQCRETSLVGIPVTNLQRADKIVAKFLLQQLVDERLGNEIGLEAQVVSDRLAGEELFLGGLQHTPIFLNRLYRIVELTGVLLTPGSGNEQSSIDEIHELFMNIRRSYSSRSLRGLCTLVAEYRLVSLVEPMIAETRELMISTTGWLAGEAPHPLPANDSRPNDFQRVSAYINNLIASLMDKSNGDGVSELKKDRWLELATLVRNAYFLCTLPNVDSRFATVMGSVVKAIKLAVLSSGDEKILSTYEYLGRSYLMNWCFAAGNISVAESLRDWQS